METIKVKVKVTKEILKKSAMCGNGKTLTDTALSVKAPQNCAIAQAIHEILPSWDVGFSISNDSLFDMGLMDKPYVIKLTSLVQNFIAKFDTSSFQQRMSMKPIEFEINVPVEAIDISIVYNILEQSETLELA